MREVKKACRSLVMSKIGEKLQFRQLFPFSFVVIPELALFEQAFVIFSEQIIGYPVLDRGAIPQSAFCRGF